MAALLEKLAPIVPPIGLLETPKPKLRRSRFCAVLVTEEQEKGMSLIAQRIRTSKLAGYLEAKMGSHRASHAVRITRMWLFMHGPLDINQELRMLSPDGDEGWEGLIHLMGKDAYDQMMMEACGHLVTHVESPGYQPVPTDLTAVEGAITKYFGQQAWEPLMWLENRVEPCYAARELRY